jgi:RimJ/RimL family protein N-acetyltransferase
MEHTSAINALLALEPTPSGPSPYPQDGAAAWIARSLLARAAGRELSFVVSAPSGVVGVCSIVCVVAVGRWGQLNYWIGRSFWSRGYATAAARRVVALGFSQLPVDTILSGVLPGNAASIRVLAKLGAQRAPAYDNYARGAPILYYRLDRATEPTWKRP